MFSAENSAVLCSREVVTLQGDHRHLTKGQKALYRVTNGTL